MLTGLLWLRLKFCGGPSRLHCGSFRGSLREYDRSTLNPKEENKTKEWPALALANRFLLQTSQCIDSGTASALPWHCVWVFVCTLITSPWRTVKLRDERKGAIGVANPLIKFKFSQLKGRSKHWEGWSYSRSSEWVAEVCYWSQMERFCPPLLVTTTFITKRFSLWSGQTLSLS